MPGLPEDPRPPDLAVADVAIVGAGLCGLALARTLGARGLDVLVIEARPRLGGRVLTAHCDSTGQALDLGATWFWPQTEPRMAALLDELGLSSSPQQDTGDALWLTDPNRAPERRVAPDGVHAGARRITGGAQQLVRALAAALPPGCVRLGVALDGLRDRGTHIELAPTSGPPIRARQVVLALPPRLVHQQVRMEPALPTAVQDALARTPTWMAAQAKAVATFAQPFWRGQGHSGNAFVRHPQAVLGEVFDAGDGRAGALGGFFALNAAQRDSFRRSLPLLVDSQLAQLFGPQAQDGRLFMQDWAQEPWTCGAADRAAAGEPPLADPALRQPLWGGRLYLGGSETAAHGAGHMEGALESAHRIARALARPVPAARVSRTNLASRAAQPSHGSRADALQAFTSGVQAQRGQAGERYRLHLTRLLCTQHSGQLTQRALLATADQVYSEALVLLDGWLPALHARGGEVTQGRHALTGALLAPFEGWNRGLLDAALAFNAGSCALSNFPQEQQPDAGTLRAITADLAAAWREFALELNARLLLVVDDAALTA